MTPPYPFFRFLSVLLVSLYLVGCSDSEEDNISPPVPEPETVAPASQEQLVSVLEQLAEQSLAEDDSNSRRSFRLPYTTYQVVALLSRFTGEFSVLGAALETAGLAEALNGTDPLTVFAPTDAAFAALGLDEMSVKELDTKTLMNILTYHVTPGNLLASELLERQHIGMLNGDTAAVTQQGKHVFINEARLLTPFLVNLPTRNGIIHIINGVLTPPEDDGQMTMAPDVTGLAYAPASDVPWATNALQAALETNPNVSIIAHVRHAANAARAGLELAPTELFLFGNPALGTPLMQINQTIGIDLPQKMLVYENDAEETYVTYNTPAYLARRHGIAPDTATLPTIGMALKGLAEGAAENAVVMPNTSEVEPFAGLVVTMSSYGTEETYGRLVDAVEGIEPLQIIAEVDHAANAEGVGLTLRPTKLLVFGNPNLGTPLMQTERTVGIDLPQKMLVWEDAEGQVYVAYNDPYYLAERHSISADQEQLATIEGALRGLAQQATE